MPYELQDETLYSTDGAFVAATELIDIDSEVDGLDSVIGEASLVPLALKRTGIAFIDAYDGPKHSSWLQANRRSSTTNT